MNYKELYSQETIDLIEELVSNSYALVDILNFINEKTEEDFRNYYETYCEIGEEYSYEAVDALINKYGLKIINYFEDYCDLLDFYIEEGRDKEEVAKKIDTYIEERGIDDLPWCCALFIGDT